MAPNAPTLLLLLSLLPVLFTASSAAASAPFNITTVLQAFPSLSAFNDLLTQTKLASEINRRSSITVLALDGSAIGAISGLAPDVQKRVAAVHVLLDYFDAEKINSLNINTLSITTLYQTTGTADHRQGYVNMSEVARMIKFGSSMPGSPQDSELVKVIYSKPYNLSVFQISKAIIPPEIEKSTGDVRSSPASSPKPATTPASSPKPAKAPASAATPEASTPTAADAPAADTPTADSPAADVPAADSPVADAPAADSPAADAPNTETTDADADAEKSSSPQVAVGAGAGAVTFAALVLGMRGN